MLEENWQNLIEDDLDLLSEIINPVQEKSIKLEEGENRIVSIFFLDIKGFTAMSENLHPEEVKRIIDKIFKVFTNVILKNGGYVDKYEGDLIMAHFGSKKTSETDTERAIKSGLEILNKLKQINLMLNEQKIELGVRIGINTGFVTTGKIGLAREGDFTVYGDEVNIASRMESLAPINSIMIPYNTKQLVSDVFRFKSLGKMNAKGKTEAIDVYCVTGLAPQKIERWDRSKLINKPEYIGRDKELKEINQLYKISQNQIGLISKDYKPYVIALKGVAGLGKSRLIHEFVEKLSTENLKLNKTYLILKGYTKSYAQPPYTLFTTMLKNYFRINENDTKQIILEKFETEFHEINLKLTNEERESFLEIKPILGLLLGLKYEDSRLIKPDQKSLQSEIQLALRYFIEAQAKIANYKSYPLIVIFEDLHWLDSASLKAFKTILGTLNIEEKRSGKSCKNVFFLLSYRDEFIPFREFDFHSKFKEYELKPLSKENSDAMIHSILGCIDLPERIRTDVLAKSQGIPFYIEEWVNSLIDNELIEYDKESKHWILTKNIESIPIPETLNSLILSRIDRMEASLKAILQKASVIGTSFLQSILEAIESKLNSDADSVNKELMELKDLDWLIKEEELKETEAKYIFKHILTCNITYKTILNFNKKILHKLIAEIAEEKFKDNKEYYVFLAKHFEKAEIPEKATIYYEKAGDFAKDSYENEKAIVFYNNVLNNSDDLLTVKTNLKKGNILELIGRWKDAEKSYLASLDVAEKLQNKELIAQSLKNLGWLRIITGKYTEAMKIFQRQLELGKEINSLDIVSNAIGRMGNIFFSRGETDNALECFQEKLKIDIEQQNKRGMSKAFGNMGVVCWKKGNFDDAMENYLKKLELDKELGDKIGISIVVGNMGVVYENKHNYSEAMKCYQKKLEICEKLGDKRGFSYAVGNMANIFQRQGNHKKAMECYRIQLCIGEELQDLRGIAHLMGNLGHVYFLEKKYPEALKCYNRKLEISNKLGDKNGLSSSWGSISAIHFERKEYSKALELLNNRLKICREISDMIGVYDSLKLIGDSYLKQKYYGKAVSVYDKLLALLLKSQEKKRMLDLQKNRSIAYLKTGDYDIALSLMNDCLKNFLEKNDLYEISRFEGEIGIIYYKKRNHPKAIEYLNKAIEIDESNDYKNFYVYHLFYKARILFDMDSLLEAKTCNDKAVKLAGELNLENILLYLRILNLKIINKMDSTNEQNVNIVSELEKLLISAANEEEEAIIKYELILLANQIQADQVQEKDKNQTISILKKLYEKTSDIDYKNRYQKLEVLVST